jgi:hypothetical protein
LKFPNGRAGGRKNHGFGLFGHWLSYIDSNMPIIKPVTGNKAISGNETWITMPA